jgi:capsular polysaccharide biosynthesis protein
MSHSFTPYNTLENAFRSWWVIVVLMLLGALLGFVLNQARPPLYEAHAAIAISIDFTRSGDLEDYEEDYVIGIAGAVIASSQVREAVAAQMGLPPAELADRVSFERSYAVWTIRARDPSPQRAAELANVWADEAYQALGDSLEQAMLASRYAGQLDQLERCLVNGCAGPVP